MLVPVDEFRVGAGRCACPSTVTSTGCAGRHGSLPLQDLSCDRNTDDHDRHIAAQSQNAASTRTSNGSLLLHLAPREIKGCLVRIVIADLQCGLAFCWRNNPLGAFHSPDAIFANKE